MWVEPYYRVPVPVSDVHVGQPAAELRTRSSLDLLPVEGLSPGLGLWRVVTYLWIVPRVEFFGDRDDVLSEELQPLLLKANLVHVDIHGGDVLIASGQTLVLDTNTQESLRDQDSGSASLSHTHSHTGYLV